MPHDRGNLVLVLPLAEANALLEEPLAVAVGFGNAFVICPHCADILSRDLDDAGRALHPTIIGRHRQ